MGAPRARTGPDLMIGGARRSGSAAAVLDFAVTQLLRDDTALGALPAVLARLDDEIRATAHAVAAIVATQIRHANDMAKVERSHAALADQTERLNCLIASAIPGVLITDEQGTVTNASQSFGAMFGLDEPLAGASAVSVMHRIKGVFADPADFTRRAAEAFRARRPVTGEQARCTDGRTLECDYWPVLVDGRHRGDIWLTWDMSDRT